MNKEKSVKMKRVLSTLIIAGMISSCNPAKSVDVAEIPTPITSTALPPSPESDEFVVAPEAVAESVTTAVCPTTEEAQELIGVPVQRLANEPCAWVWRGDPNSISAVCPRESICSWDVVNDIIVIHHGINQIAKIRAGTWRFPSVYPPEDNIHDICKLYRDEKNFAANEVPSFEVRFQPVPGVGPQSCPEN